MYVWLWRNLAGGPALKALQLALAAVGTVLLLFFAVFPRVEQALPYNHVDVTGGGAAGASSTGGP